MESVYLRDTWNAKGVQIEYKKRINLKVVKKDVMKFINRNDIAVISSWGSLIVGTVISVILF